MFTGGRLQFRQLCAYTQLQGCSHSLNICAHASCVQLALGICPFHLEVFIAAAANPRERERHQPSFQCSPAAAEFAGWRNTDDVCVCVCASLFLSTLAPLQDKKSCSRTSARVRGRRPSAPRHGLDTHVHQLRRSARTFTHMPRMKESGRRLKINKSSLENDIRQVFAAVALKWSKNLASRSS